MSQNILIIKMSALGDIFVSLPQIEAIVQHHHDDQVTLLTGPGFNRLFIHHPRLNVQVLDRKETFGPMSTIGSTLWAYQRKFDVIYDLQGNRISRTVVRFSGAAKRVGTQPRSIYTHHPEKPYTSETQQNITERLNETLIAAGIPPAGEHITLHFSDEERDVVNQFKQQHGLDSMPYILFHAGSSSEWPSKQWPRDYFVGLAELFSLHSISSVWIGGPEDIAINQYLSSKTGIDTTNMFSFTQLSILAEDALCAVTNDSGPMHILAAANIPIYSFFGSTSWVRSHAIGQQQRVLTSNASCSPCFKGICTAEQKNHCLSDITVEKVYEKIHKELQLEKRAN